ncbi:MAG: MFS transporter [Thermoanaerobaculia bacterium]
MSTPASSFSPPERSRFARTFDAFRYRDFRLLWLGAFTSTSGTWMQTVAQSWIVLSMTGSAFYLGVDAFLATLPMILFSLLGGVVADRFDRRKILLVSQLLQMTFAFVLAGLIASGAVAVWHIFVLSFLTGTVQSIGGPAYQALFPILVPREGVSNAIALNSMQFNLARMIGPVLAALALAGAGPVVCFVLNGVSFIPVILSLLAIRTPFVPEPAHRTGIMSEMREGLRFMAERRALTHLTMLAFATSLFAVPLVTLLPAVTRDLFHLDASGYGLVMTASGAGSVIGALLVAGMHPDRRGRTALWFQLSFSVFLLIFATSRALPLSVVAIFCAGASLLGVVAMVSSLVQLAADEAIRGRVMSVFMMAFRGGMPIGNLLSGWVAATISIRAALTGNAIALALIAIAYLATRNDVKEF